MKQMVQGLGQTNTQQTIFAGTPQEVFKIWETMPRRIFPGSNSNHNLNTRLRVCVAADDLLVVITATASEPKSPWEESDGKDNAGRNQNHINPRIS
jgi:hypothetical protein